MTLDLVMSFQVQHYKGEAWKNQLDFIKIKTQMTLAGATHDLEFRREHLIELGPWGRDRKGSSNRECPLSEQSCGNTAIGWFPPRQGFILLAGDKCGEQRHRKLNITIAMSSRNEFLSTVVQPVPGSPSLVNTLKKKSEDTKPRSKWSRYNISI